MLKAEQIPDEVWHTAMSTYHKTIKKRPGSAWQEAIAAALNAWPGTAVNDSCPVWHAYPHIILPLPKEKTNAEG